MKTQSMLLASLAALALGVSRGAAAEATVSVFYDALEPHGEWIEVSDYGYCWTPRGVDAEWSPYTDGQWAYTDAGWTWVSEEPYGWAVYHYGRWANVVDVGWAWVPDTEWAPAWVSWRNSERYVGWAPLPPESRETIRVGVNLGGWVDTYYDIGPTNYSFVEVQNLGAPRLRTVLVPRHENITVITQTRNITNVTVRNNIIVNEGPEYNVVVRQSKQPIRRLKLDRQVDIETDTRTVQGERYRTRVQGESLSMPAPHFQKVAAGTAVIAPKKVGRKVETAMINRGWKDAGDAQKVETFRTKMQAEAKPPENLPPVKHRERAEGRENAPDRSTAKTGEAADPNARPPGTGRQGRTPADGSRPPTGTARTPGEDPNRPTADTSRPPADDATKPSAETRPGGANRPGRPGRPDAEANRPAAGTADASRPGATTPEATAPDRPDRPNRPGAEQRKPGERRAAPADGTQPRPDANPGAPGKPANPAQGEDRAAPPAPTAPPPPTDAPAGAKKPGAGRPEAPEAPKPIGERSENNGPDGARSGAPRPDRPQGARGPGADRPEGARGPGPGQGERGKPPGAGADAGGAQGAGPAGNRPGKADADKPGKADGEKPDKEKKDRE